MALEYFESLYRIFVKENESQFDVVTFFQVLEHIADVHSFLTSALLTLKTGGKVILAVPNNEPYYLKYDRLHFLKSSLLIIWMVEQKIPFIIS